MIERVIAWCAHNRFLVFTGTAVLVLWGVWALRATPMSLSRTWVRIER